MEKILFYINDKPYNAELESNSISEAIINMCPFELTFSKSGSHEYYAALPQKPNGSGCEEVSQVKANGIYYFEGWNALSLVFADKDISPYKVHKVGTFCESVAEALSAGEDKLTIRCQSENK